MDTLWHNFSFLFFLGITVMQCVCDRVRQKELQDERLQDALHEAEKPLARYSDDTDLDARLREQEREGDTMLAYIRKKKEKAITKSKFFYFSTNLRS